MGIKEIIEKLKTLNEWRRGGEIDQPNPTECGFVIDEAIKNLEDYNNGELPHAILLSKVSRVEVVDQNGRRNVNWDSRNKVELNLQDEGKTLKIFVSN